MMKNVTVKTCLNQKIIKNSNLHDSGNEEERISDSECDPKAAFFRKPNLSEYLPNVTKCGLNTRHDNREVTLIHLTRAQTLRSDKCATGSVHANGSMTINVIPCQLFCRSGLCLGPSAIHLRSKLQKTINFAGITIHWALRRIFWKIFFEYLMITNVMVKTCLNQKIIKNSNLIQAMKNSVCPTANVIWRPIFTESRIFRSLRIVDSTHDMIMLKWNLLNFSKAEFVRIFTECSEVWIEHTTWQSWSGT